MEAPVAVAGGAAEGVARALLPRRHELAAAVHRVATDVGGVVLPALSVPHDFLFRRHRAVGGRLLGVLLGSHGGLSG